MSRMYAGERIHVELLTDENRTFRTDIKLKKSVEDTAPYPDNDNTQWEFRCVNVSEEVFTKLTTSGRLLIDKDYDLTGFVSMPVRRLCSSTTTWLCCSSRDKRPTVDFSRCNRNIDGTWVSGIHKLTCTSMILRMLLAVGIAKNIPNPDVYTVQDVYNLLCPATSSITKVEIRDLNDHMSHFGDDDLFEDDMEIPAYPDIS
ncbi:MAG: hypothetical protein JSS82_07855 [Bacteroidetes bacterium]|nr:hypothetical protein [Bacteroidota bacterium]